MGIAGGKGWRIASFVIVIAFIFSIAWRTSAVAQQTVADELLDVMRANHQITEEQYQRLKKRTADEKAALVAAIAQQVKAETAKVATVRTVEEKKPFEITGTGKAADNGEGGVEFKMKGITVNLGGFLEEASLYRSRNENSDIGSYYQKIPLPNSASYFQDETRFTARQSRLSLLAKGDYSDTVHLAGYYEMDFLGAAPTANSNESNSYNLRIRHLYGTGDWDTCGLHFLFGQSWSLVTQDAKGIIPRQELLPLTIDAQYVPGFNWARQPQLRIVKDWDKTFWLGVSVENPQTTAATPPNTVGTNYAINQTSTNLFATNLSVNNIPDIVVKAAYDPCFGHFEVFNLVRTFESSWLPTGSSTVTNQQITRDAVGGGFSIPIVPNELSIMASTMYGQGIGRYGSGQLPNVAQDKSGAIEPITAWHLLGGLTWQPLKQLQFYAYYGRETANRLDLAQGTTAYGYGSIYDDDFFGNITSTKFNGQIQTIDQITIGDWWTFYQGRFGTMKLGLQYSYTQDKYFDGSSSSTGYVPMRGPTVADHMFFTSVRYYWD